MAKKAKMTRKGKVLKQKMTIKEVENKLKDKSLTQKQRDKIIDDYMNSITYK